MEIDCLKVNKLENGCFKYVVSISPIDWWEYSLSEAQIIDNLKNDCRIDADVLEEKIEDIRERSRYIEDVVSGDIQKPHTIRFTSIPNPEYFECSLVGLAKIDKSGICYVFSDNEEYLNMILKGI